MNDEFTDKFTEKIHLFNLKIHLKICFTKFTFEIKFTKFTKQNSLYKILIFKIILLN